MKALAITLLASLSAAAFTLEEVQWENMNMDFTVAQCITWDENGQRILVGTHIGFHSLSLSDYQWYSCEEEGMVGRLVGSIDACTTQPEFIMTGRHDAQYFGYLEVTPDGGETWLTTYMSSGGEFRSFHKDINEPGRCYAGGISLPGAPGEFVVSTDNGMNWTAVPVPLSAITDIAQTADGTLYICGIPGACRSTDGGMTWETINSGLGSSLFCNAIAAHPSDASVLFLSDEDHIYRTENGGESWIQLADYYCMDIEICPWNPDLIAAMVMGYTLVASDDGGENWYDIQGDIPGNPKDLVFCAEDNFLYAATTYDGTYRTPVDISGTEGPSTGAVSGLGVSLSANPVIGSASFSFSAPAGGTVRLDVFDTSGRLVETLADGEVEGGTHSGMMDLSSVPPGVFFLRLTTGEGTVAERFTLCR